MDRVAGIARDRWNTVCSDESGVGIMMAMIASLLIGALAYYFSSRTLSVQHQTLQLRVKSHAVNDRTILRHSFHTIPLPDPGGP